MEVTMNDTPVCMTRVDTDEPIPDPGLESKFTMACQSLDQFLFDLERMNLHAEDVARYMGPVLEAAETVVMELKRVKTRLFVPKTAPYPVRSIRPTVERAEPRQTTRARLVREYQQQMTKGIENEQTHDDDRCVLAYGAVR
jgi:hypothetical protein